MRLHTCGMRDSILPTDLVAKRNERENRENTTNAFAVELNV